MGVYKNFVIEDLVYVFEDADYKYDNVYEIYKFTYNHKNSFITFEWDELTNYIKIVISSEDINLKFFGRSLVKILLLDRNKGILTAELEYEFHSETTMFEVQIQLKPKIMFDFDLH